MPSNCENYTGAERLFCGRGGLPLQRDATRKRRCIRPPANQIFRYEVRLLGIDEVRQQNQSADDQHRYSVGDRVWIRHPSRRCDSRSLEGTVTRLVSPQNVEVDGMPRHVRDLRLVTSPLPTPGELSASEQPHLVPKYLVGRDGCSVVPPE
ncbi:hypothetical protein GWK47_035825 [Chionoecetes opilio]|uniref:Uncharacterized protein n=1 Tax=Chionoecetes opilio TaxID=41210 RepID=A0A8J4YF13_CHIOP|nr:hypothetical protein GWK47_035825 [Chionoecetes opilio]